VIQSDYYKDPESGDSREIDVVAYRQVDLSGLQVRVSFFIECKLSKDKPWIVFTSEKTRLADRARIVQRPATRTGAKLLQQLSLDPEMLKLPLFRFAPFIGYSVTQAFTSGHDVSYGAATSVSKAALAETVELNRADVPVCLIAFPAVVIDGKIFATALAENGQLQISATESATLIWRNPIIREPHTIIHLTTLDGLETYCRECYESTSQLFQALASGFANDALHKYLS
jgi:hypothetical protein